MTNITLAWPWSVPRLPFSRAVRPNSDIVTTTEGSTEGQLANVLTEFSQSLAAFWVDLGDLMEDTVVVTMSEFGRTARENGNRGTDHGHANVMFVMGGPVKGGKVYGRW